MKLFNSHYFVKLTLAVSLLAPFATAQQPTVQDSLNAKLEDIESRRGLEVGGTVRSVMLRSAFSSEQDINAYDKSPDTERNGFSQFDLKLGVRPWETTRGNVVLRMAANYQDYFQALKTTVSIPWINMEGQVGGNFYWVVGDFRQQYSPLTLFSPDVDVLYEPEIYARNRYMARDQVFLSGNQRNLQGANLKYRQDFGGTAGELRAEFILSRLRRFEVLDFSGATGNILPNEQNALGASQASGMDKLLYTGNLEWLPLDKNLILGFTPIIIKDLASSNAAAYYREGISSVDYNAIPILEYANPGVLGPENAQIMALRFGADGAGFIGNENLILNLVGEYAMSKDDHYFIAGKEAVLDEAGNPVLDGNLNPLQRSIGEVEYLEGKAFLLEAALGFQEKNSWMVKLNVGYIMNDSAWYNPLAQSPAFFARRVANSDKDNDLLKYGVYSPFYSTFDALYHFVPKFMPTDKELTPGGGSDYKPTDSYVIAPFQKNSYNTGVYTRDELALINALSDKVLQSALPNGLATANRVGPVLNVTAGLGQDNVLEIKGIYNSLQEVNATMGEDIAQFTEFGGGGKFDVGTFVWGEPLSISGSYKNSKATQGNVEFTSDFINAGVYARYFKRFGVSFGIQQISSEFVNPVLQSVGWNLANSKQSQWMIGLDYSLGKNAWFAINYGQISVTNTYKADDPENASSSYYYLPVYIEMAREKGIIPKTQNNLEHAFQQSLLEASINVDF